MEFFESDQLLRKILVIELFEILERKDPILLQLPFQDLAQLLRRVIARLQQLSSIPGRLLVVYVLVFYYFHACLEETILFGSLDLFLLD